MSDDGLEAHLRADHRCVGPFTLDHHANHHKFVDNLDVVHVHAERDVHAPLDQTTRLAVDIEIGDGAWWPYLADSVVKSGSIERVGNLPNGTTGGQPALQILVTLDDGTKVVAQTTWANFSLAMVALIARWGTP